MSDTTIDDIFELAWLGFEHQECEEDCTEADYYKQAKSALYELMLSVIGEDEEVPRPLDDKSRARFYRKSGQNFLRNQQRNKLKELMK